MSVDSATPSRGQDDAPEVPQAKYAGFRAELDCEECGSPFTVEGDVSNGETVVCEGCGEAVEVYGR